MTIDNLDSKIVSKEKYYPSGEWFSPIIVSLDTEGYIRIWDDYNSYSAYFHKDEIDKYYELLEMAYDKKEWDEELDEECTPGEINLDKSYIECDFNVYFVEGYRGNWIVRDRIWKIQKCLIDFKNKYIKPLTIDDIKEIMKDKNEISIGRLIYIKGILNTKKEERDATNYVRKK